MSDHQAMATDFAQEFLAASPSRGDVAETSPQSPSSSSSPGPVEEEQTFSPDWVAGQFTKPNGRKEGDSGFISPDGATNQGTNPFYGANFHPTLNQDSSTNLTVSAADSDFKPLDSSLESENDRYEQGPQESSENDETEDGDYKKYNELNENDVSKERFESFRKPSFTDFSGLESKLCEFENSRNKSNDVKIEDDAEKAFEIITDSAGEPEKHQQIIEDLVENKTINNQHEIVGSNAECELIGNNFENKSDNCFDQLETVTKPTDPCLESDDYDYKVTQDVGCNITDPQDDSDTSSSDGEDHIEKKDQEKDYSSSSDEAEEESYEKLPAHEVSDEESDAEDVAYEVKTETSVQDDGSQPTSPLPVQQDTDEHTVGGESQLEANILINQNFQQMSDISDDVKEVETALDDQIGTVEASDVVKEVEEMVTTEKETDQDVPVDEFESNVDEEEVEKIDCPRPDVMECNEKSPEKFFEEDANIDISRSEVKERDLCKESEELSVPVAFDDVEEESQQEQMTLMSAGHDSQLAAFENIETSPDSPVESPEIERSAEPLDSAGDVFPGTTESPLVGEETPAELTVEDQEDLSLREAKTYNDEENLPGDQDLVCQSAFDNVDPAVSEPLEKMSVETVDISSESDLEESQEVEVIDPVDTEKFIEKSVEDEDIERVSEDKEELSAVRETEHVESFNPEIKEVVCARPLNYIETCDQPTEQEEMQGTIISEGSQLESVDDSNILPAEEVEEARAVDESDLLPTEVMGEAEATIPATEMSEEFNEEKKESIENQKEESFTETTVDIQKTVEVQEDSEDTEDKEVELLIPSTGSNVDMEKDSLFPSAESKVAEDNDPVIPAIEIAEDKEDSVIPSTEANEDKENEPLIPATEVAENKEDSLIPSIESNEDKENDPETTANETVENKEDSLIPSTESNEDKKNDSLIPSIESNEDKENDPVIPHTESNDDKEDDPLIPPTESTVSIEEVSENKEEIDEYLIPSIEISAEKEQNVEISSESPEEEMTPEEKGQELHEDQNDEKKEEFTSQATEIEQIKEEEKEAEEKLNMQAEDVESKDVVSSETFNSAADVDAATEKIEEVPYSSMDEAAVEISVEPELSVEEIPKVETDKVESEEEPIAETEEKNIPVDEPVKAQLDAEKNVACNEPIAVNDPADDASIETTAANQQDSDDKVTNDSALDNKPAVGEHQTVPASADVPKEDETQSVEDKDQVTETPVAAVAAVGAVAAGAAVGVTATTTRKSPKPPSTLALTKTTTSKPAGKPREPLSSKATPKPRVTSSKPLVPPATTRATTRPASATTTRSTASSRAATANVTARPATAPQKPSARPATSRPITGRPTPTTTTTTARPARSLKPEVKAPAKTTTTGAPAKGPTTSLKMKLTPRPTSTSRLREASAARVKVEKKPTTPTARTPLSQRVTASTPTPTKTKTPTKPSSASASSKELPNTPFARARQARLAAKEKKTTASDGLNGQQNGGVVA